jgi:hypothetical protein
MLKTCFVALLAIAMSIGVAQARHVRGYLHVIPACAVGQPTAWKCNCSAGHPPVLCQPGQWCHPNHMMGVEGPQCGF